MTGRQATLDDSLHGSRLLLAWLAFVFFAGGTLFLLIRGVDPSIHDLGSRTLDVAGRYWTKMVNRFRVDSLYYWLPLIGLLAIERTWPARRGQRMLSVGLRHDLVWLLMLPLASIFFLAKMDGFLSVIYTHHLAQWSLNPLAGWPVALQAVTVILIGDFLNWLAHFLKHKVRLLWYFHAVHHSQREMNFATDYRVHPVEKIFSMCLRFLPLSMLELEVAVPLGIGWWLFTTWHTAIYHANIRSNYGLLRYVIVTPQSHRIHHSREPEHQDKNFGTIFSIWDYLFGTQHRKYDEYPETGVADADFPMERDPSWKSLLLTPLRQLIYPFTLMLRRGA